MKKKLVKVCDWCGHIYPYTVLTSRAHHPVHMIEGGDYITEDMDTNFNQAGDMGVFGLNQKDYEWFKAHLQEVEVDVED